MEPQSGNKVGAGLGDGDGGRALPEEVTIKEILDFRLWQLAGVTANPKLQAPNYKQISNSNTK